MRTHKAAVVGLGNIGMMYDYEAQRPHPSTHAFAYQDSPYYELICGVDNSESKQKLFRELSQTARFYVSLDEAMESGTLNDAEVVSICTPPSSHVEIVKKLISSNIGKILFCEKPIVQNAHEAGEILDILRSSSTLVVPNISRRWNRGLRNIGDYLKSGKIGEVEKINVRYTRGIYNTGAHLFDLIHMWTGDKIASVSALSETKTSSYPEKSYNFYFETENGITGYAEAVNDYNYYLFEMDLYCTGGKVEMRNSGDDVNYYSTTSHHLFDGYKELKCEEQYSHLLEDSCIKNAINNIHNVMLGKEEPYCSVMDAIYPVLIAEALEKSYNSRRAVEVTL